MKLREEYSTQISMIHVSQCWLECVIILLQLLICTALVSILLPCPVLHSEGPSSLHEPPCEWRLSSGALLCTVLMRKLRLMSTWEWDIFCSKSQFVDLLALESLLCHLTFYICLVLVGFWYLHFLVHSFWAECWFISNTLLVVWLA